MKELKDGRPKCDYCDKPATRNLQDMRIEWSIDKEGNYSENPIDYREISGDNTHLCNECADV